MSDVNRKVVPDKGSLNRERPVTKAHKFPSCTDRILSSELEWRVERHDDEDGGRVPSKTK